MASWREQVLTQSIRDFKKHSDKVRAAGAYNYMKGIAPFLGISAPQRRKLETVAWSNLETPTSDTLGATAKALMRLKFREYHYAAYDLVDRYIEVADEYFLAKHVESLLTTKSWWDTVDGLVNAAVSPLCFQYDARSIISDWSRSKNIWLVRAAIGHQRGWKRETDVDLVMKLCHQHWKDPEFFVAKAIGWALRDIAAFNSTAVKKFLKLHSTPNKVARKEAERGVARAERPIRSR